MNRNGFGLEVVVGGRVLPEYQHDGKTYIAAPFGREYCLRFNVPTYGRHMAVASVDGLDILTGKRASVDAGGYVMTHAAYPGDNDIPGFRLNNSEVARFTFGERSDSYASLMDKPENVGVLAVVFFAERRPVYETRGGGMLGGGRRTRSAGTRGGGHDMGTEFGRRTEHHVSTTTFDRGAEVARFVIEYASESSLRKAGILPRAALGDVNPFPSDGPGCTPPSGWRGGRGRR